MTVEIALGLLRHALTAAGAALVTLGITDDATSQSLVGAAMTLAGFVASVYVKRAA